MLRLYFLIFLLLLMANPMTIWGQCQNGDLDISVAGTDVLCNGSSDGTATTNPTSGVSPFSYEWSTNPVQTTITATNLVAGTYTVTVTDANGCTGTNSLTIDEPSAMVTNFSVSDVLCAGENSGTIDFEVSGGIPPYTYSWSSGQFSEDLIGAAAGTHTVTVTDNNGCTVEQSIVVNEPPPIDANMTNLTPATCGACNGSVTFQPTGGAAPPYLFAHSNFTTANPLTGLCSGTYTTTITDVNGCTVSQSYQIPEIGGPDTLVVTTTVQDVDCNGNCNGEVSAQAFCGTPPYTYNWSTTPPQITATISDVCPGNYTVTITDGDGLTAIGTGVVQEPAALTLDFNSSNVSCAGDANGWIEAIVAGGTTPFSYQWSASLGSFSPILSGVPAGIYTVTVTDNNGCTVEGAQIILEPAPLVSVIQDQTDATCGDCNGSASFAAAGGTGNYTYTNLNHPGSGDMITGLCAGSYTMIVTDANGCTSALPYNINNIDNPDTLLLDMLTFNVSCNGGCDGGAAVAVSCGTTPYTYDWGVPGGSMISEVINLCAGTYDVTVTDANGITGVATATINEPDFLSLSGTVTDASCFYNQDGCVDVLVTGGTQPYTYTWSNGVTTSNPCDLALGVYHLTVTDFNGCAITETYTISTVSDFDLPLITNTANCNNDGTATVTVSGGETPYTYSWSTGDSTATITGLSEGLYHVTITDATGCTQFASTRLEPVVNFDITTTPSDCNDMNGSATVVNITGSNSPTVAWSNGGTGLTQSGLNTGGYSVTVTDGNTGCRRHQNTEIMQDSSCFVTLFGYVYDDGRNADCAIDGTSVPLQNIRVELNTGQVVFTNSDGFYRFLVPPGTYTISAIINTQTYEPICADPITLDANMAAETYPNNNFYYKNKGNFDLNLKVNKGRPRPGFERTLFICVMNYGSTPVSGTLTFQHDPRQEYRGANFPESAYDPATSTVTWDFSNLAPGPVRVYRVRMYTPVTVPNGTVLQMTFEVTPINGDLNPSNNKIVDCPVVTTNSYDPNDKAVTPAGEGAIGRIDQDEVNQLEYRVRFQNTGTDTAYTVVVRDQLDESLDPATVVPGASSHDYTLSILDGNILEFRFDSIYLPDSFVNEPASNGFVFFDVQLREDLEPGTEITNEVDIFFDFNPPIRTNTVLNTIRGTDVFTQQEIVSCDSLLFNGNLYFRDTIVIDTFALVLYDSIVTTTIDIEGVIETRLSIIYCPGENPVDPGIYTTVFTAANGCDSVVTTEVNLFPASQTVIDTTLLSGETYNGQVFTEDTILTEVFMDQNGCDSTVITNIMVTTTSSQRVLSGNSVKVFPNPTRQDIHILFAKAWQEPVNIQLYNILGQPVASAQTSEQQYQLTTQSLPAGTYWLVIQKDHEQISQKVILLR